jgi:hypothetical protein
MSSKLPSCHPSQPHRLKAGGEYESDECIIEDVNVGNNIRAGVWVQAVAERRQVKSTSLGCQIEALLPWYQP